MLINSNRCDNEIQSNICIVGSGVGAGTLAVKLAQMNMEFTVVEAGDIDQDPGVVLKEHVGHDFGLRTTTSVQLGGTSNLWHGVLSPLDDIDFEKRDWIPHSGWPIGYEDLHRYYMEAGAILGVKDYDYFFVDKLSEDLRNELSRMPLNRELVKNKLYQQPLPAKNFKYDIISLTRKSDKYHCLYNAVATELEIREDNQQIISLKFGTLDGKMKRIRADIFVICAGALETPRLLLNSKRNNGIQPGNEGDNVGRFLMDHPMGNLCQIEFRRQQKAAIYSDLKYRPNIKIKTGIELLDSVQREMELPNHNFYIRPSFIKGIDDESERLKLSLLTLKDGKINIKDIYKVLTNLNVVRQIVTYKYSLNVTYRYADLFFMTEQIPNPNSRVKLSQRKDKYGYPIAQIDWQVVNEDIDSMLVWFKMLQDKIFPHDHFSFTHKTEDFNWNEIFTSAVHHVGTARMATSEKTGVIDSNLKVFGTKNLYVSDGSVFTTAGNVNSSFTISAFSCRLAAHLSSITSRQNSVRNSVD